MISDAITKLIVAFVNLQIGTMTDMNSSSLILAEATVECLDSFLKSAFDLRQIANHNNTGSDNSAKSMRDVIPSRPQATQLVTRCVELIDQSCMIEDSREAERLAYHAFAVLIDGSAASTTCWTEVKNPGMICRLLEKLLLRDTRTTNRQSIAKLIREAIQPSTGYVTVSAMLAYQSEDAEIISRSKARFQKELVSELAGAILSLIGQSPAFAQHSEQFFEVALLLLKSDEVGSLDYIDLDDCANSWLSLLIDHCHDEVIPVLGGPAPVLTMPRSLDVIRLISSSRVSPVW